ncbi:MAG: hypothetical protein WBF33_08550 [Candidatus Nitrosopolaris sp.]|jgi:hypothetical protein
MKILLVTVTPFCRTGFDFWTNSFLRNKRILVPTGLYSVCNGGRSPTSGLVVLMISGPEQLYASNATTLPMIKGSGECEKIGITVPSLTLKEIDKRRKLIPRSTYISDVLQRHLRTHK